MTVAEVDRSSGNGLDEATEATRIIAPTSEPVTADSPNTRAFLPGADIRSPREAMLQQEVQRMRLFTMFAGAMSAVLCFVIPALPGDPLATRIHLVTNVVTVLVTLWLRFLLTEDSNYKQWMGLMAGLVAGTAVTTGFYYWGAASSVCLVIPIGVYFFALNESISGALLIYLYGAGGHALVSVLQIAGLIPDVGIVRPVHKSIVSDIGMLFALQSAFLASFIMARALRRSSMGTLQRLEHAIRDVTQREALLNEAKDELARIGRVGDPGRFSEQVIGSYRLGVILGRGSMGDVYEAVHTESGEPAALKLLSSEAMRNKELVSRFYRELDISSSLDAINIVQVLEHAGTDAPMPYLAMERLNGMTLAALLRKNGPMTVAQAIPLLQALAHGIDAAHAQGIIHRDLKPQNIFAHKESGLVIWKILDFGVSKLAGHQGTLTQDKLVGTPAYMAPEQALGGFTDHRADLYSIAVLLYRVLTGRPAFTGVSIPVIIQNVATAMPPRPSSMADLTPDLDLVLGIAMAKNPMDRFASGEEMYEALQAAAEGCLPTKLRARGMTLASRNPWK